MMNYKEIKKLSLHDPLIEGFNRSFFVRGYFPKEKLKRILPKNMTIPSERTMAQEFPTVARIENHAPFLMLFSRCYNVHDVITKIDLRTYLELLFYFPVIYSNGNRKRLCSFIPVLYLDYLLGTLGGMVLGLRKQFHPKLSYIETDTENKFILKDILQAKFELSSGEDNQELDPFFTQIFEKPTATVSYFNQTEFYTASVQPTKVIPASASYEWNYKGARIINDEHTVAHYCEYRFTTSWAMRYAKYFHPKYPVGHREENNKAKPDFK